MHCWLSLQFKLTQSLESKEKVSKDTSSKKCVSDFANCISNCTQCINRHTLCIFNDVTQNNGKVIRCYISLVIIYLFANQKFDKMYYSKC